MEKIISIAIGVLFMLFSTFNSPAQFMNWANMRNPLYTADPGYAAKDAALGYRSDTKMFYLFFSDIQLGSNPSSTSLWHIGCVKTSDFKTFTRVFRHRPAGWVVFSPSLLKVGSTWYLVYSGGASQGGIGNINQLYYATSNDLENWNWGNQFVGNLTSGIRSIDANLANFNGKWYANWKLEQTPRVAVSSALGNTGWTSLGQPNTEWFENGQFLQIDGKWHIIGAVAGAANTGIARMIGDGTQDAHWTQYEPMRRLNIPGESWNTLTRANAGYIADFRTHDGFFYVIYCGRTTSPTGWHSDGDYKLGIARSKDLWIWEVPPGNIYALSQAPYGGTPASIPGTIQAERYDTGGEGAAYHDTDTSNNGGQFRPSEGVDLQSGGTGNYITGWGDAHEWMEYTVNITTAGSYTFKFRYSSGADQKVHISIDAKDITRSILLPSTGGYSNYTTVTSAAFSLPAGQHVLQVYFETGPVNLDWIEVMSSGSNPAPSVNITSPSNGATFNAPASIGISANASDSSGAISNVQFFAGSTSLGADSSSPYAITWSSVAAGTYNLTARATDNGGATTTSAGVNAVVNGTSSGGTAAYRINAGGGAASPFTADAFFSGGSTASTTATIDMAGVVSPAPMAVYQSERYGNITYTFSSLSASASHKVRLHFAETYHSATGRRVMDVNINGTQVLNDYDVFASTGARNKAQVREFNTTSSSSGTITVQFITVVDNAKICGIEIIRN